MRWTLQDELDWFTTKAEDPETPPAERELWARLAEELGHRLNNDPPEEPPLW